MKNNFLPNWQEVIFIETGNYVERIFPFFGVRFIAVTDGFDSEKDDVSLMVCLSNIFNEYYSRDLGKWYSLWYSVGNFECFKPQKHGEKAAPRTALKNARYGRQANACIHLTANATPNRSPVRVVEYELSMYYREPDIIYLHVNG